MRTKDQTEIEFLCEAVHQCSPRILLEYIPNAIWDRPDLSDTQIEQLANAIGRIPHQKKWRKRNA